MFAVCCCCCCCLCFCVVVVVVAVVLFVCLFSFSFLFVCVCLFVFVCLFVPFVVVVFCHDCHSHETNLSSVDALRVTLSTQLHGTTVLLQPRPDMPRSGGVFSPLPHHCRSTQPLDMCSAVQRLPRLRVLRVGLEPWTVQAVPRRCR